MKQNALKKRTLRLEQLESRELLSATTWNNALQADAAVAAEMAATLDEAPIDLSTIMVDTGADVVNADDGLTSLREAIAAAQAGDTIVFAEDVTEIVLAQNWWENSLVVNKSITIDGGDGVAIDASGAQGGYGSSVFQITGGTEAAPVKLAGLTITGGDAGNGGGIYVDGGYVLVEDSTITGNNATNGGAVYVNAGFVAFDNVEISSNTASTNFAAVGINHLRGASASFDACLVVENEAAGRGAIGALGSGATIEVANTTITANESAKGAALYGGSSTVAIKNSIVAENTTAGVVASSSDVSGSGTITATNVLSGWSGADIEYDATKPLFEDAASGDYTLAEDSQALGQGEGGSDLGAFKVSNENPSLVVTVSTDVVDPTDGKISLREALAYMANDATLGAAITFDASLDGATILLTEGELEFTNNTKVDAKFRSLKIDASALANGITVDAQGESRVFNVFRTSKMDSFRATFNNLTIVNGYAEGNGGGIYSALDIALVDCDLIDNQATGSGAGVYSAGATVSGSYFKGNLAWGGSGGGLYFTGSNMSITDSTFEKNGCAAGSGGGIYATGSNNTFDSLTFVENVARDNGGGLALDGAGKQKQATNLTFENNLAFTGNGGGLYFAGSNTTFDGLTLVGNEAGANGGGFYGAATLTNSTIVGNFASVDGGGIYSTGGNISKTLIADNVADGVGGGLRLYGAGSKLTNVTIAGNTAEDGAGVYSQAYNAYYDSIVLANVDKGGYASDIAHNGSYRSVGYNVVSTNDDWDAEPVWGSKLPSENVFYYVATSDAPDYSDVFEDAPNGDYSLSYNSLAFHDGVAFGAFEYDCDVPSTVVTIATDVVDPTDGEISLREALAYMANGFGDAIAFDASLDGATILLTEGELEFTSAASEYRNLKIDASALENGITIDAQSASRVFNIFKTTGNFRPTFVNLTIANGCVDGDGAGIYSSLGVAYALTLTDCVVANNVATGSGGGVYSLGATVAGSVFMSNVAGVDGGGLYFAGSNMSITDSAFASNDAGGSGGGVYAKGANNTFDALLFVNNEAGGAGGGLALDVAGKQKQATDLTFKFNEADGAGGGLYFAGSNTTFDGLTLVGNEAGANGGGFYGAATLTNSTITDNFASVDGGGIYSTGGNISKTLIADNVADGVGGGLRLYGAGSKLTNVTIAGNTAEDGAGVYSQAYNAYYDSIVLANVDWTGDENDIAHNGSYRSVGYNVVSTYDNWDAAPSWGSKLPSENAILYVAADGVADYRDVFEDAANGDYSLSFGSLALGRGVDGADLGAFESPYEIPSLVVTIATDVVDPTDGEISLREALAYMANDATLGKSITFDASLDGATIYLTQGELEFTNNTTGNENKFRGLKIDASALANGITIDAQDSSRVFRVFKTTGMDSFRATFNNLTIANGCVDGDGAGIYSAVDVVLNNCVVDGNVATGSGAGVYAKGATVSGSNFSNNEAGVDGGGLYFTGSNMSITASTFENNVAGGSGGGIYATGGNNTFDALTFSGNVASVDGGGLALVGASRQTKAANLTFDGNVALGNGGGLYFAGSNTTFDGLTFADNSAANGGGFYGAATLTNATITGNYALADGGGIYSTGGNISNSLIADNVADGFGGGLRLYGAGSKLTNVTIAGNVAADGAGVYSQAYNAYYNSIILANVDWTGAASDVAHNGSYRSVGYNVLSTNDDWDAAPVWGSKQPSSNTILYSGDYTDVFVDSANGDYSLAYGSPAIGEGDVSYVLTETDLAGADRVRYELVDLGAFESPYAVTLDAPSLTAEAISASEIILTVGDVASASGYVVEYSLTGDFSDAVAVDGSTLAGLNAYTTYYFRVKSLGENSYVDSAWSETVSATTLLATPTDVTFKQLKFPSADGVFLDVKWTDGEGELYYRVEYREVGTEEWTFVANCDRAVETSQWIVDFAPGKEYEVRLRAENADGVSAWSTPVSLLTMAAPTIEIAAVDGAAQTATLTFVAPTNATQLRVEILDAPFTTEAQMSSANLERVATLKAGSTSWTLKGLDPSKTYYCRVRAFNDGTNISDWAELKFSLATTPTDVVFVADETDATRGVVSWTNNGSDALGFQVETSKDGVVWELAGTTTETSFELTDLTPGEERHLRVRSQICVAVSDWAFGAILNAPTNLVLNQAKRANAAGTLISVKWTDASDFETQYRVEYREAGAEEWTAFSLKANAQYQAIYDFTPSATYEFRVRAENADGVSAWTTTSFAPLAAPTVDVASVDSAAFALSLSAPENATKMRVEISTEPFATEAKLPAADLFYSVTLKADATKATIQNLDPNATYYVRVRAINADGDSAWSEIATVSLQSAPTDVVFIADEADATRGVVSWTNNAAATEFQVETSKDGVVWELAGTTTETTFELTDLTPGEERYLRVRSQNENGASAWTLGAILNAPTDLALNQAKRSNADGTLINVKWTDASDLATLYRVEYREAGTEDWTTFELKANAQNQSVYDFTPGSTYEFRVRAENAYGASAWTTASVATTAAPTVELVSRNATSFTLSLLAPENATKLRVEVSDSPFATEATIASANLARAVTLDADVQNWTPSNLESGATYYVRVRAINADGVSDWSDVLEVKLFNNQDFVPTSSVVSEAFADLFAEDGEDDFWFEFEKATGARK